MRWGWCVVVVGLVGGCASVGPQAPRAEKRIYEDASSSALVFDPPVTAHAPPTDFWRTGRAPEAFVSWDGPSETYFYTHTFDRLTTDGTDRFIRRAVVEKVGVSYR